MADRPGRADGAGADLPVLPDRRLPTREAPPGRAARRLQRRTCSRPCSDGSTPVKAQPADVPLAKVERPGDSPARPGRSPGLHHRPDRPPQPDRHPRGRRRVRTPGRVHPPGSNIPPLDEQGVDPTPPSPADPTCTPREAAIEGAGAAVRLAKGDRIPTTIIGPQYVQDEAGIQYVGLNIVPTLADPGTTASPWSASERPSSDAPSISFQQAQPAGRGPRSDRPWPSWNGATGLVTDSSGLTQELDRRGRQPGAPLRAGSNRPHPGPAGSPAADPARKRPARRGLERPPRPRPT